MKEEILNLLKDKATQKIQLLEMLIAETRASNNDTKSSMGDKYETSREMLQQEINTLQIQLNEQQRSLQVLKSIHPKPHVVVGLGSLVETENGTFFIAVSGGTIVCEDQTIVVISAESPLAKSLMGKKKDETFIVNNLMQTVRNIS